MTTVISGSSPSITFSDSTTQTTAFTSTPSVTTITTSSDASISGLTVGKGGGAVATNTALGYQALNGNSSGVGLFVAGYQAGLVTTGSYSTFTGYQAGKANTSGENTAYGANALLQNTTGTANTALGGTTTSVSGALASNTTGGSNVGVGVGALSFNTTASNNTAVGYQAAYNSTVAGTTAIGYQALYTQGSPAGNTAVGYQAGKSQSTNGQCTYVGYNAGQSATAGNDTAVGYQALYTGSSGGQNSAFGSQALNGITSGSSNTAVGYNAGTANTTGFGNTLIGANAGVSTNPLVGGAYNVLIGSSASASGSNVSNEMLIISGNGAVGKGANTSFINGGGGPCYQGNNSTTWTATSDRRLKKNIVDNTEGLSIISQIRIRNFEYRIASEVTELPTHAVIDKQGVQLGVIAQELQEVCSDCVKEESTGVLSVDASNLTWHMINAIKDLKALNDSLTARIVALEAK